MDIIIIANTIALFAALLSIVIGFIKSREKIILIQTIQFTSFTISNYILKGFSGAIANAIGIIRNILSYKEKLTKVAIILIITISIVLTLYFNNLGIIGFLPLINTIIYTLFINQKDPLKFKLLLLITFILWFIYDINIKSYTSAFFDLTSAITAILSAFQIHKNSNNKVA